MNTSAGPPCANANSPHGKPPSHGCSEAGGFRINLNFAAARHAAGALINNSQRSLQRPDMAAVAVFILGERLDRMSKGDLPCVI